MHTHAAGWTCLGSQLRKHLHCLFACRLVDEVVWVKMTVNRRLAKSHGFYLQHAKEVRGVLAAAPPAFSSSPPHPTPPHPARGLFSLPA